MEGQVGQPERQRQGLRRKPRGLEAERRERDAGRRAQRKSEPPGESGVPGGNQSGDRYCKPGNRDGERARERRGQYPHPYFTLLPGCAPLSGEKMNTPRPSPPPAETL